MNIEALCAASPEALPHSPSQMPNATELPSSAQGRPKLTETQSYRPPSFAHADTRRGRYRHDAGLWTCRRIRPTSLRPHRHAPRHSYGYFCEPRSAGLCGRLLRAIRIVGRGRNGVTLSGDALPCDLTKASGRRSSSDSLRSSTPRTRRTAGRSALSGNSSSAKWKPPSLKRPTSICFVVIEEWSLQLSLTCLLVGLRFRWL